MNSRIKQFISTFKARHIDAFLVTQDTNIAYLTHFPASESWLLVGNRKASYITDFRYILEARKGLKGIGVVRYIKSRSETLFQTARQQGIRRLGFDPNHLTLAQYRVFKKQCPRSIRLVEVPYSVENLREIKDATEIKCIRQALNIHKQAYQLVKKVIRPNVTEQDILSHLEKFVKDRGVRFSFSPIVASGPNSCYPHAKVTGRKLKKSDIVLVDIGIEVKGYKSDLTRMFFLGRIPPLVQKVNDAVAVAQRKSIEKIRPGVPVAELDLAARNHLAKNGLAQYFGHALGHGVGLDIHESPRLAQANPAVLKAGMVITIEPAVYIPRRFGIRIEDMVLVTPKGCEVLSGNIHQ